MTIRECIEKVEAVVLDKGKSDVDIYDELYDIVVGFDVHLDYFFEDYFKENYVYEAIWHDSSNLGELYDQLSDIASFTGIYYRGICGWETADLFQLRDEILKYLRRMEQQLYHTTDEPVVWVEEDDNFLTKEVTK